MTAQNSHTSHDTAFHSVYVDYLRIRMGYWCCEPIGTDLLLCKFFWVCWPFLCNQHITFCWLFFISSKCNWLLVVATPTKIRSVVVKTHAMFLVLFNIFVSKAWLLCLANLFDYFVNKLAMDLFMPELQVHIKSFCREFEGWTPRIIALAMKLTWTQCMLIAWE